MTRILLDTRVSGDAFMLSAGFMSEGASSPIDYARPASRISRRRMRYRRAALVFLCIAAAFAIALFATLSFPGSAARGVPESHGDIAFAGLWGFLAFWMLLASFCAWLTSLSD